MFAEHIFIHVTTEIRITHIMNRAIELDYFIVFNDFSWVLIVIYALTEYNIEKSLNSYT